MGKRQQAYRDRRLAQGWERIEFLVPAKAAPWLRAYAGALRSAADLGLPMPRFDGMGTNTVGSMVPMLEPLTPSPTNITPQDQADTASPNPASQPSSDNPQVSPAVIGSGAGDMFKQMEDRRNAKALADGERRTFESGIFPRRSS